MFSSNFTILPEGSLYRRSPISGGLLLPLLLLCWCKQKKVLAAGSRENFETDHSVFFPILRNFWGMASILAVTTVSPGRSSPSALGRRPPGRLVPLAGCNLVDTIGDRFYRGFSHILDPLPNISSSNGLVPRKERHLPQLLVISSQFSIILRNIRSW